VFNKDIYIGPRRFSNITRTVQRDSRHWLTTGSKQVHCMHAVAVYCFQDIYTLVLTNLAIIVSRPRPMLWLSLVVFTCESRMLRASLPSSGRPSVCLSVRPSVTLVICIKTVQARITKSLLWTAPRSLVYRDKISCHWVQGFPSNEGVKEGYPPLKKTSFCRYWLE